jgi:hypothetical protein
VGAVEQGRPLQDLRQLADVVCAEVLHDKYRRVNLLREAFQQLRQRCDTAH